MTAVPNAAARDHADRRWAELNARLRTITPRAIGRAALAVGSIVATLWVLAASWPAIVPFLVGAVIAYAVLPIANRLDAFMPRVLAALLAEVVALGVLAGAFVLVVPPLLRGVVQVALKLPTADRIQTGLADLEAQLGNLPDPVRGIVLAVTTEVVTRLSAALDQLVSGAATFITDQMLGVLGTVSFVVGLLVIPAWILTMVADEGWIKRRAMSLVAPAIRQDVSALARIVDRAFSAFLRGQVLLAISTGVMVWAGLELAGTAGVATYPYAVPAATLIGMLQLIPELGFFLGWFPVLLVLVIAGPVPAAVAAVVYVAAVKASGTVIGSSVHRGVLDVHPGLLIPGIVVLSQFGVGWLLFGAPIIAVARDTVRYLAGRLSETPTPAGVLPGDRRRASRAPVPAHIPSVYRGAATRERSTVP